MAKQTVNTIEVVQNTIKMLTEGNNIMKLEKKIVLVLGITGSGKSTLLQFLTDDNSKLISVEEGVDTNEYIIYGSRISNQTVKSQTLYPELLFDTTTNTSFYDCPGFEDTRSVSHDITATYLIKQLIDNATNLKVLLVINYSMVQKGQDRTGLPKLLKHTTELIKNIDNYNSSIGLVVTKVENKFKRGKLISDEAIINNIGVFFKEVKRSLQDDDPELHVNSIKLIDIFLTRTNHGLYENIVLFRRPDDEGPLSQIVLLQNGKQVIQTMITNLMFANVNKTDFGYTISDKSKSMLFELNDGINLEIINNLKLLNPLIVNQVQDKIMQTENLYEINKLFENQIQLNLIKLNNIDNEIRLEQLMLIYLDVLDSFQLNIDLNGLKNVTNFISYINFLQQLTDKHLQINLGDWYGIFTSLTSTFTEWNQWIDFCFNIFETLSGYNFQSNKQTLKLFNVEIKSTNFNEFIDNLKLSTGTEFSNIKRIVPNNIQLRLLNTAVQQIVNDRLQSNCVERIKLTVNGFNIKLSDVLLLKCSKDVPNIEIFAMKNLFIDVDIDKIGSKTNIVFVSSNWKVIGNRKIILNGKSADYINGKSGLPGKPGGPAGNFFGLVSNIQNGENLKIFANGGDGGKGQDGTDGIDGKNGILTPLPSNKAYDTCDLHYEYERETNYVQVITIVYNDGEHIFIDYSTRGERGENGADGGHGGIGGQAGKIETIYLNSRIENNIVSENHRGINGVGGNGGIGGQGGWQYKSKIVCKQRMVLFVWWSNWRRNSTEQYIRSPSGLDGRYGFNDRNIIQPEINNNSINKIDVISNYLGFIKKKINSFTKYLYEKFVNDLSRNEDMKMFWNQLDHFQSQSEQQPYLTPYKPIRDEISQSKERTKRDLINTMAINNLQHNNQRLLLNETLCRNKNSDFNYTAAVKSNFDLKNFNNFLLLADILIRKYTDRKFVNRNMDDLILMDVQAYSIQIVDEFETLLAEYSNVNGIDFDFDPIHTQCQIFYSILRNNSFSYVSDILFKSVVINN